MARFVNAFEQACSGQTLNYTANGSGAGINEFTGNQTDFGGSDVALSDDEHGKAQQRCGSPAWDLPVVFGPIAVTYNVNGVTSLNLDGPTAAKIFNGTIKNWNDPAITALNAGTPLPDLPIHVVFRSDQSGNDGQLPEVPRRRVQRCLGQGQREVVQRRCRRGRQGQRRNVGGDQEHRRVRSPITNGRSRRRRS